MNNGKVYIVGAGPGDPELITVKGLKAIQAADVIVYDRLVNNELLGYAKRSAEMIYCGKLPSFHTLKQETIHRLLVKHAKNGKIVTRLKGGDPFVFGRGAEEAEALRAHSIPYEIIPGITAGISVPAYAGIPVTHREYSSSFTVMTGHHGMSESGGIQWKNAAKASDTLVIYMGMKHLAPICQQLKKHGRDKNTPAAVIQWGTTSAQKTVVGTLDTIAEQAEACMMANPAIIIIGEVAKLHNELAWFEKESEPLFKEA